MEDLQWWPDGDDAEVWVWYVFMVVFCAFGNLWHLASTWRSVGHPSDAYGTAMKWLAIPWVVNCAWRSVFPSLYMERFAFWNTPLNSILLGRTFAFVGELSWVFQTCLAMRHVDKEVTKKSTCWVQLSAWSAFGVYVVAEAVSYYNTATENQYWGAVEVTLRLSHAASFSIPLPILAPPLSRKVRPLRKTGGPGWHLVFAACTRRALPHAQVPREVLAVDRQDLPWRHVPRHHRLPSLQLRN